MPASSPGMGSSSLQRSARAILARGCGVRSCGVVYLASLIDVQPSRAQLRFTKGSRLTLWHPWNYDLSFYPAMSP